MKKAAVNDTAIGRAAATSSFAARVQQPRILAPSALVMALNCGAGTGCWTRRTRMLRARL
jgi:hypothetical protein